MARITIEDCSKHYSNRFELVLLAAKRARQMMRGHESMLPSQGEKPAVVALREIGKGVMTWETFHAVEERERQALLPDEDSDEDQRWSPSGAA